MSNFIKEAYDKWLKNYGKGQKSNTGKYGQGSYMNLAPNLNLNSVVQEIGGMPIRPPQYGRLANRVNQNRARQFGLLRNERLKGLLG